MEKKLLKKIFKKNRLIFKSKEREIENPLRKSGWLGGVGGENKKYTVETS